ncbi:hypothetical protein ACQ4PT_014538 [Festuca glaucescens]
MMMMMSPNAAAELDIARGRWGLGWFVPARAGDLDLGAMATCQSVSEWLLCGIRIWEMGTSSSVLDDIRRRFLNLLSFARAIKRREGFIKMVLWVFGYGSLIWNPGFDFDDKILGFITGYKRTFNLACIDHRGTPKDPARTCTLESEEGAHMRHEDASIIELADEVRKVLSSILLPSPSPVSPPPPLTRILLLPSPNRRRPLLPRLPYDGHDGHLRRRPLLPRRAASTDRATAACPRDGQPRLPPPAPATAGLDGARCRLLPPRRSHASTLDASPPPPAEPASAWAGAFALGATTWTSAFSLGAAACVHHQASSLASNLKSLPHRIHFAV